MQGNNFDDMGNCSHHMKSVKSAMAGLKYSLPVQFTERGPSSAGESIVTPALLGNNPVICRKSSVCSATEPPSVQSQKPFVNLPLTRFQHAAVQWKLMSLGLQICPDFCTISATISTETMRAMIHWTWVIIKPNAQAV